MPRLIIAREGGSSRQLELGRATVRLGRDPDADIFLDDPAKGVSRLHAEIRYDGTGHTIVDLNSRNGTWVDGRRTTEAPLVPGTVIVLGPYTLRFEATEAASHAGDEEEEDASGYTVYSPSAVQQSMVDRPPDLSHTPLPNPPPFTRPRSRARDQALLFGTAAVLVAAVVVVAMLRSGSTSGPDATAVQPVAADSLAPLDATPSAVQPAPETQRLTDLAEPERTRPLERVNPPRPARDGSDRPGIASKLATGNAPASDRLKPQYLAAKSTLDSGDLVGAIAQLEALQREQPGYLDVATLLADAQNRRQADARQALDVAAKAEQSGALTAALQAYERAQKLEPSRTVDERIAHLRDRMQQEGAKAYADARKLDAFAKTAEAIASYQRAIALLPPDDPRRKEAATRVEVLSK